MKFNGLCLLVPCVAAMALFCTDEDTGPNGPDPGPASTASVRYTYDSGVFTMIADSSYCYGSQLVEVTDTVVGTAELSNDTLTITLYDTLGNGAFVVNTRVYVREGTGDSIEGTWTGVSDENVVTGPAPLPGVVGDWADDTLLLDRMMAAGGYRVAIDSGGMVASYTGSLAELMLPVVFDDVPEYVTVTVDTAADGASATVTGGVTGEIVTLTFDGYLNIRIASSSSSRPQYLIAEFPVDCGPVGAWLDDFFVENSSFAEEFIDTWLQSLVGVMRIEYAKEGESVVRVTGQVTGEVVTVTYDGQGGVMFTSTNDTHPATPTSWPAGFELPQWWQAFIGANAPT